MDKSTPGSSFTFLRVNLQNRLAPAHVRQIHRDLRGRNGPDAAAPDRARPARLVAAMMMMPSCVSKPSISTSNAFKRLFAFVVAAAEAVPATAADGVNFINENQARRVLARLLEHVAHAARADADKHFHEIRTADAEESRVRLAGDRLGQQRLARAGRARPSERPWECVRRAAGIFSGPSEIRPVRKLPRWPRQCPPRP